MHSFPFTYSKRNNSKLVILFIDLDNLKRINDDYGHKVGVAILKEVAVRIQSSVRESDTLARLGGDEFVIILSCFNSSSEVIQVAEEMRNLFIEPLDIIDEEIFTSVSIGVAIYPEHRDNEIDLMNHADMAMYAAKRNGRNQMQVFGNHLINEDVKSRP